MLYKLINIWKKVYKYLFIYVVFSNDVRVIRIEFEVEDVIWVF